MDHFIQLHQLRKNGNKVSYEYTADGEVGRYLKKDEPFWIEYESPVSNVPDAVLAVPFVGNMMALGMLFNAEIRVPALDRDYYQVIPQILEGYQAMYADKASLGVTVIADKIERIVPRGGTSAKLLYYSGGADCAYTLTKHLRDGESIELLQIHGADIPHTNMEGWNAALTFTQKLAKEHGMKVHAVRSNLHTFVYEGILDSFVQEHYSENFWHGFQHSIGMLTLSAPVVWQEGYQEIYFASTFSVKEAVYQYTCASSPTIDNLVRFCSCRVVHDGVEASRQDKLHGIVDYSRLTGKYVPMRVCYLSSKGVNCCQCEKCARTALGLYAEGENPNDYGFDYTVGSLSDAINTYAFSGYETFYRDIQQVLRKNRSLEEIPAGLRGFYTLPFEEWWTASKCAKLQQTRYQELKNWTDNLQSAKDWLEGQYRGQLGVIEELQAKCKEQKERIEELEKQLKPEGFFKKLFR